MARSSRIRVLTNGDVPRHADNAGLTLSEAEAGARDHEHARLRREQDQLHRERARAGRGSRRTLHRLR